MTAMVLGEPSQALAQTFTPAVSVPIGQLYPTVKGEDYKQPAGPVTRKMATQVQNLKVRYSRYISPYHRLTLVPI